ncbi:hypothetical protein [Paenibacillus sp. MBLB4367]|uniref:hypothetical protein n=1 Tax=Paenibacillus sp. MBLB4367 TaxID=3384767 RepID=UPI003907FA65
MVCLIEDYIQIHRLGIYCKTDDVKIVLVVSGPDIAPAKSMQSLVDHVRTHTSQTITVGLGSPVPHIHDMPDSYRQAKDALATKMFVGKCRVITLEQTEREIVKSTSDLEQIMEAILTAAANYELVHIYDCLEQLFELVHSLKDKLTVYNFALYVISKIDFFCGRLTPI